MAKNYNKGKVIGMNPNQGQNQKTQVKLNPEDLEDVLCEKCDCQIFVPAFMFKKLSAVLSPTGKDTMVPLQTYKCNDCGHMNKEFLPKTKQENA